MQKQRKILHNLNPIQQNSTQLEISKWSEDFLPLIYTLRKHNCLWGYNPCRTCVPATSNAHIQCHRWSSWMGFGKLTTGIVELCAGHSRQDSCVSAWEQRSFKHLHSMQKDEVQGFGRAARATPWRGDKPLLCRCRLATLYGRRCFPKLRCIGVKRSKWIIAWWHLPSECISKAPSHLLCSFHKSLSVLCPHGCQLWAHTAPCALREGAPRLHTQHSTASPRSLQVHRLLQHHGPCCGFCAWVLSPPFTSPCGPHPTLKSAVLSTPTWVMDISHQTDPFGNLPSPHESLRPPLHVGKSPPLPKALRVGCSKWSPPKSSTALSLCVPQSLGHPADPETPSNPRHLPHGTYGLPQHPLTLTNPATVQQTYLKFSFKKLLALTFKWENPFVSASCFRCRDFSKCQRPPCPRADVEGGSSDAEWAGTLSLVLHSW